MSATNHQAALVSFPLTVFQTADSKEDLEDWLAAHSPEFIHTMRQARQDDLDGKGKDWEAFKEVLCIE